MSNSRYAYAPPTFKVRLATICTALIASGSVLGTVLVLFDSVGDTAATTEARTKSTKVAVAAASPRGAVRR